MKASATVVGIPSSYVATYYVGLVAPWAAALLLHLLRTSYVVRTNSYSPSYGTIADQALSHGTIADQALIQAVSTAACAMLE